MGHSMQLDESERTASAVGWSYRLADRYAVTGFADKPTGPDRTGPDRTWLTLPPPNTKSSCATYPKGE